MKLLLFQLSLLCLLHVLICDYSEMTIILHSQKKQKNSDHFMKVQGRF